MKRPNARQLLEETVNTFVEAWGRGAVETAFVPTNFEIQDQSTKACSLCDSALEQLEFWGISELGRCLMPVKLEIDLAVQYCRCEWIEPSIGTRQRA